MPAWIDSEWCKQFLGEQLVTVRTKRGFSRLEWQKLRERNQALDCRVYARAAAWLIGADRWPPSYWADLEAEFGRLPEPRSGTVRRDYRGIKSFHAATADRYAPKQAAADAAHPTKLVDGIRAHRDDRTPSTTQHVGLPPESSCRLSVKHYS
nr:terminase gpA endonuclease subunit [Pseudaminobacter soli]